MRLREIIAKNVADHRKVRGFNQEQLARLLKVNKQTIWRIESGLSNATTDMLEDLGKALKVEPALLLLPRRDVETSESLDDHVSCLDDALSYLNKSMDLARECRSRLQVTRLLEA